MDSTTTSSPRPSGPLPAFHNLPNVPLSRMIKNSSLVFAVLLIIFFFLRQYVLEAVLDKGLIYKKTWPLLNARQKRGFVNHHLSFIAKISVVIFAIYPFFAVVTGNATFTTPFLGSRISAGRRAASLTIGDVLFAAIMVVTVMYAHELSYREGISPVAVAHHIGVLLMGQLTLYWSARARHQPDSSLEVVLALVWGFFDLSVEVPPHVTMILYRNPNIPSSTLVRHFGVAFWCSFIGTIAETATILALYGTLWHKWTVIMKVLIPILHCIFTAAQLWGEKCTWDLWQQEKRKAKRLASTI